MPINVKAIKQRKAEALEATVKLVEQVEAANGKWTDGQKKEANEHKATIKDCEETLALAEDTLKKIAEGGNAGITGNDAGAPDVNAADARDASRMMGDMTANLADILGVGRGFRALRNPSNIRSTGFYKGKKMPFANMQEQISAVMKAARNPNAADPRLQALNEMFSGDPAGINNATDAEGGYLLQPDLQDAMLDAIIAAGVLAPKCTVMPTSNIQGVAIPMLKETARTDGQRYGGILAYNVEEAGTIGTSAPKFTKLNIRAPKLGVLVPCTDEMLSDVTFLSRWLDYTVTQELAFKLDDNIFRGSGAGAALGFNGAPCVVTADIEKDQTLAANPFVYGNITKMMGRVLPRSKKKGEWFANQEMYPYMLTLKDDADRNIFLQGAGQANVVNEPVDRLLGRTYNEIEHAEAPGTIGDISFADLSQYLLVTRGTTDFQVSIHFYFDTAQSAMRWILRVGGAPMQTNPLLPYKGTKTLSSFVNLNTRT